jgi:hypothetical protein
MPAIGDYRAELSICSPAILDQPVGNVTRRYGG